MSFSDIADHVESNGLTIIITSLIMLIFVIIISTVVFFTSVKTADQVLVPEIKGKKLEEAMLELQVKELYPRIQLKFSENSGDKGIILEQTPPGGTIVKAGRRINIVVSRGVALNRLENYVGKTLNDVKQHLASLFTSGHKQLISVKEPIIYKHSSIPAGTILEQNPAADAQVTDGMEINLVVSKGPEKEKVSVPNLQDINLTQLYDIMKKYKIIFNIKSEIDEAISHPVVATQSIKPETVTEAFSKLDILLKFPINTEKILYGLYTPNLPKYPYPIKITLDAIYLDGKREEIVNFQHDGGKFTLPYAVPHGTILILTVLNEEVQTFEVKTK